MIKINQIKKKNKSIEIKKKKYWNIGESSENKKLNKRNYSDNYKRSIKHMYNNIYNNNSYKELIKNIEKQYNNEYLGNNENSDANCNDKDKDNKNINYYDSDQNKLTKIYKVLNFFIHLTLWTKSSYLFC